MIFCFLISYTFFLNLFTVFVHTLRSFTPLCFSDFILLFLRLVALLQDILSRLLLRGRSFGREARRSSAGFGRIDQKRLAMGTLVPGTTSSFRRLRAVRW